MKFLLPLIAGTVVLAGCSDALSPNAEHCSPGYIKNVADTQGLDQARKLSSECIEAGFEDAKGHLREAGQAIKEAGEAVKDAGVSLKKELFGN